MLAQFFENPVGILMKQVHKQSSKNFARISNVRKKKRILKTEF